MEMREKLANAQALLGALVRGDYATMTSYADQINRIGETEIGSWQAVAQPEYLQRGKDFLLAVRGLREAAGARNMEAVTTEYAALVSSCVRCHTYVRGARQALNSRQ